MESGKDCQRPLVAFPSGAELSFPAVHDAELVVRHELAGVELDCALEARQRLVEIAGLAVRDSEIDVGRGSIGRSLGDLEQQRNSLIVLLRVEKAHRVVVIATNVCRDARFFSELEATGIRLKR